MGNEYMFRVYSENLCGMSEEPRQGKNTAVIAKTGVYLCTVLYVCELNFAPGDDMVGHISSLSYVGWLSLLAVPHFFIGLVCKQHPYKEKDMACVPKFTQPLVDRSVVAGYSTAISCAVRGFPRVNIPN